ncbi:MAG TPA: CBS domain-containing protein, partial [Anaerolineae bacterium]|nr:CBS domain-containing protein [Anaerolineae bacterium]
DLRQEQVIHLNLTEFTQVESGASVRATIEKMRQENHNCAFVTNQGRLVGIFTDRDILRKVVAAPESWDRPIETVMTAQPLTVNTSDPADTALNLMNERHFRNVPVLDNKGSVVGNLTHYAIVKYLADRFPESVYNLPPEPDRVTQNRDGA